MERAMIVFEYMYEMIEKMFGSLMDQWGMREKADVEAEYNNKVMEIKATRVLKLGPLPIS